MNEQQNKTTPDITERLAGPHEWGYRCVTDGTFIPDDTPFEASEEIERLRRSIDTAVDEFERGYPLSALQFLLNAQEGLS